MSWKYIKIATHVAAKISLIPFEWNDLQRKSLPRYGFLLKDAHCISRKLNELVSHGLQMEEDSKWLLTVVNSMLQVNMKY